MAEARRVLGIALVVISSLVYGHSSSANTPDAGSKSGAGTSSTSPNQSQPNPQALRPPEVLTDTMGVDFAPYIDEVRKKVRQNWYNLMPPSVYPPVLKQGQVAIEFFIQKDGSIKKMKLYTPSGDVALDRTAWGGITASNPFAPLPTEFTGQELGLRFYFYYNSPKQQDDTTRPGPAK